jgi:hypothetical protein
MTDKYDAIFLHKDDDPKVFDWNKAIEIIKNNPEHRFSAGLVEDWFWTGGTIWEDNVPIDSYCYLSSVWATPILRDETTDTDYECWKYEQDLLNQGLDWNSDTRWPQTINTNIPIKE